MRGALVAACAVSVLALFPGVALAATCPRTSLSDVEKEVMCPVCGTPLGLATEAPQAERERELIRRLVEDCRSKEEVKERLVAEYGAEVIALPGDDGFDLAAYIVPALALLLAGGALAAAALGWRRARGGHTDLNAKAPSAAASERLQSDLDRYDA